MSKVTVDSRGAVARPRIVTAVAWFMIAIGATGVVTNGYNYLIGNPSFPPALWLSFVVLKAIGLVAGVLLLQMRRAAIWLFGVSFVAALLIAVGATGPYTLAQWLEGGFAAAILVGAVWFALRNHWKELRPMGVFGHA
jgi:hypothetical protein